MFADMTDSTKLYESLGNTMAIEVVSQCINTLIEVVANHRGRVIKTIGDEVMCTFPVVTQAAMAASDMHMKVRTLAEQGDTEMQVKVGVHYGTVIEEDNDIFGDVVNVAARVASLAKPDQILVTEQVKDAMPKELHATLRYFDNVDLKGKSEIFDVYEVIWEVSDMTVAADFQPKVQRKQHHRLILSMGDIVVHMDENKDFASMGRADDCDIHCAGVLASRKHAGIEYRRGRFMLVDQSANGTHVKPQGEGTFAVKRDHYRLEGSGEIGLGEPPGDMGSLVIRYEVQ